MNMEAAVNRAGVLAVLLSLGACAELEQVYEARVQTEGAHSVRVGEATALSASTQHGEDASYAWQVDDPNVASVDASGTVTGLAEGETTVRATGAQTGAVGEHALVVLPADAPDGPNGVPNYEAWLTSPHADPTAEAFTHWNEDGSVPTTCARCHSSEGFVDYLGGDGTAAGSVESAAPTGSLVRCETCHNQAAEALETVTFPSGVTVAGLGPEARCMTCHQGRAHGAEVDAAILDAGVSDDDEPSADLSFVNVHYYPAGATLFAGIAMGGYQYADQVYDTRFRHVPGFDTCVGCHDAHSTKVRFDACVDCHPGATDLAGVRDVRMIASLNQDYDGDGDTSEGIYYELQGLRTLLLAAIQRYGSERSVPLCYADAYPYWFNDTNDDGQCAADEAVYPNRYQALTARLMRATYNYQLASKDPGAFAHNGKYIIELLYDSVIDLNAGLTVPTNPAPLVRTDAGHFNGSSEAARHWGTTDPVEASCSRCHSGAPGFRFYVEYGVGLEVPESANGLECGTCHENFGSSFDVLEVGSTKFPSGVTAALPGDDNLCANCHSGREAKATIDAQIATTNYRFRNVHYLPAAAVREGALAHVGYEYQDPSLYAGRLSHVGGVQCTTCHDPVLSNHTFAIADVWEARCDLCHGDYDAAEEVRLVHLLDYDGDGDTSETLRDELMGMAAEVLAAMRTVAGSPVPCYSDSRYPYWFVDTNTNGTCDSGETSSFQGWTPALMKAAHNYQIVQKDPGAYAHNFEYVGQLLYDSVVDLVTDPGDMERP